MVPREVRCAVADQGIDFRRLGEMPPITARHFPLHGWRIDADHVADAAIVGAPQLFAIVAPGSISRVGRGDDVQLAGLPHRRSVRGRNGPIMIRKALHEKFGSLAQDLVLRLEPGEIPGRPGSCRGLPKSNECVHLVQVALDRALHERCVSHVRVGGILEQAGMAEASQCQPIHEIPAPCGPVHRQTLQQRQHGGSDARRRSRRRP
jgi:hypothetical protein